MVLAMETSFQLFQDNEAVHDCMYSKDNVFHVFYVPSKKYFTYHGGSLTVNAVKYSVAILKQLKYRLHPSVLFL